MKRRTLERIVDNGNRYCVVITKAGIPDSGLGVGLERDDANDRAKLFNRLTRRTEYRAVVRRVTIRMVGKLPKPNAK
jgi:hypothetical protein